jgi:predicted nucleic acid-binding Zn ribbon protein
MPIYEYKCSACSHELESLQKFSDAPLVTCPAGFQLKGSGWYQTDFRGSGAKPPAVASSTGKVEAGTSDAGKGSSGKDAAPTQGTSSSDTKPAAPAAPAAASGGTPTAGA